jgi:hypothetical protein
VPRNDRRRTDAPSASYSSVRTYNLPATTTSSQQPALEAVRAPQPDDLLEQYLKSDYNPTKTSCRQTHKSRQFSLRDPQPEC